MQQTYPISGLEIVAFADPSGGKSEIKRTQARSAIVVIGQDSAEHIFLLAVWAKRTSTDKFIDAIFALNAEWAPRTFGIEANAMQSLFADALRREARFLAARLPVQDVYQSTVVKKPFRNRTTLQGPINEGRFFKRTDQVEAHNELATHPMSPTVDIVDALASAVSLLRKIPKDTLAKRDDAQFYRYLRHSGATQQQIVEAMVRRNAPTLHATPPRPGSSTLTP